ncbi:hypothetical protein BDA96_01G387000, partial [Sorghum bicolor]
EPESCGHLLAWCVFARQLWAVLFLPLGLPSLLPAAEEHDLADWWLRSRQHLQVDGREAFDSLVLLVAWSLWKERNSRVFRGAASAVQVVARSLVAEADAWCLAGFAPLRLFVAAWSHIR